MIGRGAAIAGCLLLAACASAPPARELQSVTPTGGGRYWATGSGGLAVHFDGDRLESRDYPMDPDKPDWAYEPGYGFPATHIRVVGGETLLFSRGGDVLSWRGGGWFAHDVRFPAEHPGDPPQIDRVLVLAGDRLVVQLHAKTLLRTNLEGLFAGRYELERTPTFFTDMTVIDDRIWAIGWDESGMVRALWASLERGGFSLIGRLGVEDPQNTLHGTLLLDDGSPVVVAAGGVLAPGSSPSIEALHSSLDVHGPPVSRILRGHPARHLAAAFASERGRALILLAGSERPHDAVALDAGRAVGYRCSPGLGSPIGAFEHAGGWRLVDASGAPRDFPGTTCRPSTQIAG
jgi:hypothetical protein